MRAIVASVVVGMAFALSGCACPPQTGDAKAVRSKCAVAQSQRRATKFTEASAAKTFTKVSRPASKRSNKLKTHVATPARRQIEAPSSANAGPSLPSRKPEEAPVTSPATDAASPPPVPPRKPEATLTGPSDTRGHAIVPDGKFMATKEKARREGVHSLTSEDVRGLSQEQLKELRGY
jgi:hypothetical protein